MKKPIIYGLIGAMSLLGCNDSNKEKPKEEISKPDLNENNPKQEDWSFGKTKNGFEVEGLLDGHNLKVNYFFDYPCFIVEINDRIGMVQFADGFPMGDLDGNANFVHIYGDYFEYYDNGKCYDLPSGYIKGDAQRLLELGNEKLRKIHDMLVERFGDKAKVSGLENKSGKIDDLTDELDF